MVLIVVTMMVIIMIVSAFIHLLPLHAALVPLILAGKRLPIEITNYRSTLIVIVAT